MHLIKISFFLLFAAAAVFYSHASDYTVTTKGYVSPVKNDEVVKIAVHIKENFRINYEGKLDPKMGTGDPNTEIYRFIKNQIIEEIKKQTCIKNVIIEKIVSSPLEKKAEVQTRTEGTFTVSIPENGSTLECASQKPDFVLFLDNLSVCSAKEEKDVIRMVPSNTPFGPAGSMQEQTKIKMNLTCDAKFYLWDNISKQPVSYGYSRATKNYRSSVSKGDWESVIRKFVRNIFSGTPLK